MSTMSELDRQVKEEAEPYSAAEMLAGEASHLALGGLSKSGEFFIGLAILRLADVIERAVAGYEEASDLKTKSSK